MLALQGDKPADYTSRSELFWAFVHSAIRKGIDDGRIIEACLDDSYNGNSIYEYVEANGGETYIQNG